MRPVSAVLAVAGGAALAAAVAIELTIGNPSNAAWMLIGPGPFYAVGLAAALRRPDHPMSTWMLAAGTTFVITDFLGAALREAAGWSFAWVIALARGWAGNASVVAGLGAIGLFPTGVADRRGARWTLRTAALLGLLLPVVNAVSNPMLPKWYPDPDEPTIASPLYWPAAAPLAPAAGVAYSTFTVWSAAGLIMLALRYRRYAPPDRRRIR
jgi:hypothetical protein